MNNLNLYELKYTDKDGFSQTQYVAAKNAKEVFKNYPELIDLRLIDLVVIL